MEIKHLDIENFRGIKKQKIEFKSGFNIIKGENGRGKTSILEAIAVGFGGYVAGIADVTTRHFLKTDIRKIVSPTGDGGVEEMYMVPMQVSMGVVLNGRELEWARERKSVGGAKTTVVPRDIYHIAETMCGQSEIELPVLVNLGAGRVWSQKKDKVQNKFGKKYTRQVGYTDALQDASNIKLLMNWCTKMELVAFQNNTVIAEYEAVKSAVSKFMSIMDENGDVRVFYDRRLSEMVYAVDGNLNLMSDLSAGYQSLVWMAFEIAYRMAVLNPYKKKNITNTTGVVLIDEIDLHLHPKWQWKVVDALREVFPNVQFIATTHSPILFASCKDAWVIDIEQEECEYSYTHYGVDVNTAMDKYQNTDEVANGFKQQRELFYECIENGDLVNAESILETLTEDSRLDHSGLISMRTILEFELMDLGE